MESVSLNVLDEVIPGGGNTAEDDKTFISALHDMEDAFPSDFTSATPNSAFSASPNAERTYYDPSLWTSMEIETATGNAEHTLLEHPLKFKGTYTELEDGSSARYSSGEPLVTSYNKLFLGTVDYIWRSEGLQTVRVLAPIPKQAMQWTSGFPTKGRFCRNGVVIILHWLLSWHSSTILTNHKGNTDVHSSIVIDIRGL